MKRFLPLWPSWTCDLDNIYKFGFPRPITDLNVMRQSACLVFNPIVVVTMLSSIGVGASCLLLGPPGFDWCFCFAPDFSKLFGCQGSPSPGSLLNL